MRRVAHVVLVALSLIAGSLALEGQNLTAVQAERYERLTHELIAPCCWREPIATHRSPEALQMLGEVEKLVVAGYSEKEIRNIYVSRFGPRILADPPGMDWYWLYVIPFMLLVSLMLAAVVRLRSLVARTPRPSIAAPADLLAQVRAETENSW
jgi:cytochrome c-type biogenesis protein CcmH/NrfF